MQILGRILCGQVLPVARFGSGFEKVAMLHKDHIGIEQFRKFFPISGAQSIPCPISFSDNHCGTVITDVSHNHPLAETSLFGMSMIQRLSQVHYILFREAAGVERLYSADGLIFFDLLNKRFLRRQ